MKKDRRTALRRIADEVVEGLGGRERVPAHLYRVVRNYARIQAAIERGNVSDARMTRLIGNAARLRRQIGLDLPLKRLPRVDRDQSYRDYFTDGDAVETPLDIISKDETNGNGDDAA